MADACGGITVDKSNVLQITYRGNEWRTNIVLDYSYSNNAQVWYVHIELRHLENFMYISESTEIWMYTYICLCVCVCVYIYIYK